MTAETVDESPEDPRSSRRDFLVAYAAWVVVLAAIVVALWWSSAGLSTFRYAGF